MLIVKGLMCILQLIKKATASFVLRITGEMRIVFDQPPLLLFSPLRLKLIYSPQLRNPDLKGVAEEMSRALHDYIKVRPVIEWVGFFRLERSQRMTTI
jgi:hypothetical protein